MDYTTKDGRFLSGCDRQCGFTENCSRCDQAEIDLTHKAEQTERFDRQRAKGLRWIIVDLKEDKAQSLGYYGWARSELVEELERIIQAIRKENL